MKFIKIQTLFFQIIFFLFIAQVNLFSDFQINRQIDSLEKRLTFVEGREKIKTLTSLAVQYDYVDLKKMKFYAHEAIKLIKDSKEYDLQDNAYYMYWNYFLSQGDFDSCMIVVEDFKLLSEKLSSKDSYIFALQLQAESYILRSKYLDVIKSYLSAIDLGQQSKSKNLGIVYQNYSRFLITVNKHKEAIKYLDEVFKYDENVDNSELSAYSYALKGQAYHSIMNLDSAFKYLEKSRLVFSKINLERKWLKVIFNRIYAGFLFDNYREEKKNEVINLLYQSLDVCEENKFHRLIGDIVTTLSHVYEKTHDKENELKYLQYALYNRKSLNLRENVASSLLNIANYFIRNKVIDSAKYYLESGYELAKYFNHLKYQMNAMKLYQDLSILQNDYKTAFTYSKHFQVLKDSLELKNQTSEFIRLQIDNYQADIDREQKKKDLAKQKNIIIILFVFVIVVVLMIFYILKILHKSRTDNEKLVLSQEEMKVLLNEYENSKSQIKALYEGLEITVNERTSALTQQVKNNEEIQKMMTEKQNLLNFAEDVSKVGAIVYNKFDNSIFCTEGFFHLWGLKTTEFISFEFLAKFLKNDIKNRNKLFITNIHKFQKNFSKEIEITTKNNIDKILFLQIEPIYDDFRNIYKILVVFQDITKYVEDQKLIRESEGKYKSLFNTIADPVILVDSESKLIINVNKAALNLYKYPENRFLSMKYDDILSSNINKIDDKKLDKYTNLEYHFTKDSSILAVLVNKNILIIENKEFILYSIKDISNVIKTEQLLEDLEGRFSFLLKNVDFLVFDIKRNGIINNLSENIIKILGYTPSEVIGRNSYHYVSKLDFNYLEILNILIIKQEAINDRIIPMIHKNGNIVQMEFNAVPYFDQNNIVKGFLGVAKDKTEQINFENNLIKTSKELKEHKEKIEELLQREKVINNQKTQFINMIAHQYRSPMTVISSTGELIEMLTKNKDYDELPLQAEKITYSIKILSDLIDEVKKYIDTFEKPINLEISNVEINDFIKSSITYCINKYHSTRNVIFNEQDKIYIETNYSILFLAFKNILSNALKYSKENTDIIINYETEEEYFSITIRDFGFGLTMEDKFNLFKPFYRNTRFSEITKGTGLGLAIAKESLKHINADIDYISYDDGTEFILKLKV